MIINNYGGLLAEHLGPPLSGQPRPNLIPILRAANYKYVMKIGNLIIPIMVRKILPQNLRRDF